MHQYTMNTSFGGDKSIMNRSVMDNMVFDDPQTKAMSIAKSLNKRKLGPMRATNNFKMVEPSEEDKARNDNTFIAKPTDDIPKNKLVEQLAKGLTIYVQRMMKRESFYVTIKKLEPKKWVPAPREDAQMVFNNYACYLMGGMNYHVQPEVSQLQLQN